MQKIFEYKQSLLFRSKYLFLIVLLGAVLRFAYLSFQPPSLNWDEISHGYNAYSILKTGRDEWGQLLPIANFRAYGDYPLPLNLYLTIPFIATLGLNAFAIRVPHALLGVLTIIAVYFLAEGVTKNRKVALVASFLAAIDPWLLFPSRAVFQSNLSVFFLIAGMAAFINREKNKWLMPISFLFLGLTAFSYHSTRIFTPLLLVVLIFVYRREFLEKLKKIRLQFGLSILLVVVFFGSIPFILFNPEARARSGVVFIINEGAVNQINQLRNSSNLSLKNLVYNKVTYFVGSFAKNYINYFSPDFLFLKGGTQYQFSVPKQGVLYLASLPLFYLGIIFLIKGIRNKDYQVLLAWLILSPIPASITVESGAVIRATTMLPIPEILIAIAVWEIIRKFSKYEMLLISGFVIVMLFCLENYLNVYAKSYRTDYSWAWQYGYEQVVGYVKTNYEKYDQIIVTKKYGEPHEYFLFFLKYDPAKYRDDPGLIRFYQSNWYWVDHFDKFWFVNDWQIPKTGNTFVTESKHNINCGSSRCLLITSSGNVPTGWKKIGSVNFLDGKTAFEMWER